MTEGSHPCSTDEAAHLERLGDLPKVTVSKEFRLAHREVWFLSWAPGRSPWEFPERDGGVSILGVSLRPHLAISIKVEAVVGPWHQAAPAHPPGRGCRARSSTLSHGAERSPGRESSHRDSVLLPRWARLCAHCHTLPRRCDGRSSTLELFWTLPHTPLPLTASR